MEWDAIQAISSIVQTIAVTLTVVYLAIQIKRSNTATNSQTYQFATQALAEMAAIVGETKEKSRIFSVGMADPTRRPGVLWKRSGFLVAFREAKERPFGQRKATKNPACEQRPSSREV